VWVDCDDLTGLVDPPILIKGHLSRYAHNPQIPQNSQYGNPNYPAHICLGSVARNRTTGEAVLQNDALEKLRVYRKTLQERDIFERITHHPQVWFWSCVGSCSEWAGSA
jgi:hypothetical protein